MRFKYYNEAKILISSAETSLAAAKQNKNSDNVNSALIDALDALDGTLSALSNCYKVLENSLVSANFTQAELDAYKTTISSQQTAISAAISAINSSKQNISDASLSYDTNVATAQNSLTQANVNLANAIISAQNSYSSAVINGGQQIDSAQAKVDSALKAWELAKVQLSKTESPARSEDIRAAEAQVAQVQAALESAALQIDNSVIKAPLDGIITGINYEEGEDSSSGKAAIAMLGENNLEIEVLISETDVAKVNKNNEAEITLDAFGDDRKLKAFIVSIDPAETIIQEVIYYKVNVAFADAKETLADVRSGMTANVLITTNKKDSVLIIPSRAIIERADGVKIVRILADDGINEVPVGIGIKGDAGKIEIISGLKEGDIVVTSIKENK
ncbi:MAG: efflux RND transporter periplasmic adaptor subunit [Patescibacteria group bacterium]